MSAATHTLEPDALKPLTKELRRATCVHEAGHAVVHALGGTDVYRVAVAPVGATSWGFTTRKGRASTDLWGVCEPGPSLFASIFMRWNANESCISVDSKGLRQYLSRLDKGVRREAWRELRAALCASEAGPIAEALYLGIEPEPDYFGQEGVHDDAKNSMALDALLPWRNELEAMHALTVQALRRPDVWGAVLRLADELERVGDLTDAFEGLLPEAVPGWPPSPKSKTQPAFFVRVLTGQPEHT